MKPLRWSRTLLALGLLIAGCKSQDASAGPGGAGGSAAAAQAAPAPAAASTPAGAISYLRPAGSRCEWVRQPFPSGEPAPVFAFDAECVQAEVSWSPSGTEGLVFVTPDSDAAQPRAWRVDLGTKTGKPVEFKGLPLKPVKGAERPRIERMGFDAQGKVIALLYLDRKPQKGGDGERFINFEGNGYPVDADVESARLAIAYRLEASTWKRFETKASSMDPAVENPGTEVLEAAKALPAPGYGIGGKLPGREASKSEAQMLNAALPGHEKIGKWMFVPTAGGALVYHAALDEHDDSLYPATPVRWEQGGKLQPLEGLKAKDDETLAVQTRGDLLLLYVMGGDTHAAYLYDARTKKRLASADNAVNPTFWPESSKP